MKKINFYIPIQKVDEEKRLVYGIAIAEERDCSNEVFDYESSKPYIKAWSDDFKTKTDGKSLGNLRAMHNAVSAGKVTALDFDDQQKAVKVCAKVIDNEEWSKVLEGIYTGFSFGGYAIKRWKDTKLNAMRYTLQPAELSLADKPCVPSAVFEIIKTDGTTEKRRFKNMGGIRFMEKVEKNMDMTQFLELMKNIQEGLAGDDTMPDNLKVAVDNLVNAISECTGEKPPEETPKTTEPPANKEPETDEEKAVKNGCGTEKIELAAEIQKAFAPLAKSLEGVAGIGEAISKVTKSVEDMQKRIEKIEKQPQAPKVIKLVQKVDDGKVDPPADSLSTALDEIKKAHNFQTCAY